MESLFESELSARLRAAAPGALGIVATGLLLPLLADAPQGWAAWIVLPAVLMPALINALEAVAAAREGRDRLLGLLPLSRRQTGLVRSAAPAVFQTLGGVAAVLLCLALTPFDTAASGLIPLIAALTAWLLLLGQAVALYEDLQTRRWGRRLGGAVGGAAAGAAIAVAFALALTVVGIAGGATGRALVVSAAVVVTHPWDIALASIAAAWLVVLNTELFVSRDLTAH